MVLAQEPPPDAPSRAVTAIAPHIHRALLDRGPLSPLQLAHIFEGASPSRIEKALEILRDQGNVQRVGQRNGRTQTFKAVRGKIPADSQERPPPIPALRISEWEGMTEILDLLELAGIIPTADVGWGGKTATIRAAVVELIESRRAERDLIAQVAALVAERDAALAENRRLREGLQ